MDHPQAVNSQLLNLARSSSRFRFFRLTKSSHSACPISESESDTSGWRSSPTKPTYNTRLSSRMQQQQPQTSITAQKYNSPSVSSFGRTLSTMQRNHVFVQKTVFKPETCEPCGKRIKFNKTKFCCRDCKATCHPECKDKVPVPCVPASTPGRKNKMVSQVRI